MIYGLDLLGAAKFRDLAIREFPEGWAFGVFANTFGNALPVVTGIAKTRRPEIIRINLLWDDAHNFTDQDISKAVREARRFRPLIQDHPYLRWMMSGATEHQKDRAYVIRMRDAILSAVPELSAYVNQPWQGKGAIVTGDKIINEVHGDKATLPPTPCAFSCDGSDAFDFDIERKKTRFQTAEYFMFWTSQFNGRKTAGDKTPRPQRKAWPTSQLIDATIYLHRSQGAVKLPDGWLVKPKSDQHTVPPAPRELKPVIIAPVKVDRLELVAQNGQVVHVSSRPQAFADGRWRYYFDQYGYQISEKAVRIQGSPVVRLRAWNRIVGTLNIAFRQGGFR